MILLICHPKVCSKFQGELAITESDEDYKRCDMYIIVCVKLTGDQFFQGWLQSFTESPSVGGGFALQMFKRLERKTGIIQDSVSHLGRRVGGLQNKRSSDLSNTLVLHLWANWIRRSVHNLKLCLNVAIQPKIALVTTAQKYNLPMTWTAPPPTPPFARFCFVFLLLSTLDAFKVF